MTFQKYQLEPISDRNMSKNDIFDPVVQPKKQAQQKNTSL